MVATNNSTSPSATGGMSVDEKAQIRMSDQTAESLTATIDFVSMSKPGFIVIHEDTNGTAGEIIGASELVDNGESRNIGIYVRMVAGAGYYAMLHADDGDGLFNPETDGPVLDKNNEPVMTRFNANSVEGAYKG